MVGLLHWIDLLGLIHLWVDLNLGPGHLDRCNLERSSSWIDPGMSDPVFGSIQNEQSNSWIDPWRQIQGLGRSFLDRSRCLGYLFWIDPTGGWRAWAGGRNVCAFLLIKPGKGGEKLRCLTSAFSARAIHASNMRLWRCGGVQEEMWEERYQSQPTSSQGLVAVFPHHHLLLSPRPLLLPPLRPSTSPEVCATPRAGTGHTRER